MNIPAFDAVARYRPFLDSAIAVIAPEEASSEYVEIFVQVLRDIVTSSIARLEHTGFPRVDVHTMSFRGHEEVLPRGMPYRRAIVIQLRRPKKSSVCITRSSI